MPLNLQDLSRAMSHALRHQPWLYELELDDEGWTTVSSLLSALQQKRSKWARITSEDFHSVLRHSAKRRFEINDDKIRALYGHSVPQRLKKRISTPPEFLFHGTDPAVLPRIMEFGLQPMNRQYVHLSTDTTTALEVGRRKSDKPTILEVNALEAHKTGVRFCEGNEIVWLADQVPVSFIRPHS